MSDTPRTDEQTFTFATAQVNLPPSAYKLVSAGFARQLERELNEAKKDKARLDWIEANQQKGRWIHDAIHWDGRFIREAIDEAMEAEQL